MFPGGFGVGLTVADLAPPPPEVGPPIAESPALADVLPVCARTAAEKAAELQRVGQLEAALAAYEVELVAAFAADRPASLDRQPGQPGAAADPGSDSVPRVGAPEGVSEFFADELALTLNCARATATVLTEHALTLTQSLPATLAELARGRLDWPRTRTMAEELGEKVRGTDPAVIAEVETAVLPEAAGLSVRRLQARLRAELAARDAAASDRAREDAQRAVDVRRRPMGDGVSELIAGMTDELAAACQAQIDALARRAKKAGDDRPLGMLRSGVLADLILRPWAVPEPVAAHLDVQVPLDALHLRPVPRRRRPGAARIRPARRRCAAHRRRRGGADHRRARARPARPARRHRSDHPARWIAGLLVHRRPRRPERGGHSARAARRGPPRLPGPPGGRLRLCGRRPAAADRRLRTHRGTEAVHPHSGPHLPAPWLRQPRGLGRRRPRHPARRRRGHRLRQPR